MERASERDVSNVTRLAPAPKPSLMAFLGCAYRRRTGACTCDNPPIGCKQNVPPARQPGGSASSQAQPYRLHFPAGVSSYRELREGPSAAQRTVGGTVAVALPQPARPMPEVAPAPPRPLPTTVPLSGGALPAVGWHCSGADAAAATASGVKLFFADGAHAAESALGAVADATLCTTVVLLPVDGIASAVAAALARMRRIDALLLRWSGDGDAPGLEEAFAVAAQCAGEARVLYVGLRCEDAATAQRLVTRLLAAGGARPALLALPLHAATPRQRVLVGLCRRSNVRVMALSPCGPASILAAPEVAAAAATREACAPAGEATADALLAWCVGREVVALPSAGDASLEHVAHFASAGGMDLQSAHRSAIDAAGDRLSSAA
jgi:diketogulonate reductase-like aldo/keto reductase